VGVPKKRFQIASLTLQVGEAAGSGVVVVSRRKWVTTGGRRLAARW